ncbi:MAG: helix-turn-helix domain-containing protein [Bacteroidia bacterium]|nr:helix-turn-helix domain-containing protein [Bacteroidia bacterium]
MKREFIAIEDLPLGALTVRQYREMMFDIFGDRKHRGDNSNQTEADELMKLRDVIKLLKVSRSTIFSWKKAGVLIGHTVKGSLFFKKSDIMMLFESNKKSKNK